MSHDHATALQPGQQEQNSISQKKKEKPFLKFQDETEIPYYILLLKIHILKINQS